MASFVLPAALCVFCEVLKMTFWLNRNTGGRALRAGDGLAAFQSSRQRSARPRHVTTRDPVDPVLHSETNAKMRITSVLTVVSVNPVSVNSIQKECSRRRPLAGYRGLMRMLRVG